MIRFTLFMFTVMSLCAQSSEPGHIPLPADLTGALPGAEYAIRVPENWNGTLLVYAHGSATTGVQVAPPAVPPAPELEEYLLSRGYALAGSFYSDLEDGPARTVQLTELFKKKFGDPGRVIVWGVSLGGSVALRLIENHAAIYHGAIAVAPVAAGSLKDMDFELRYGLAYAAVFGWPSEVWGPIEDLRDDLLGNEATLIAPVFQWDASAKFAQWEFVRLVMKVPREGWYATDPLLGLPGFALDGWKATALRSNAERIWGGPVAQNLGVVYTLTPQEKEYLRGLGLDVEPLLDWMNQHTKIGAKGSARNHLEYHGEFTGVLHRPVVTMHSMFDPMLPAWHESAYRSLADAAGNGEKLVQTWVTAPGHVPFSPDQFLAALAAMEHWLDTGQPPGDSFFPASKGFDNAFVAQPWPY